MTPCSAIMLLLFGPFIIPTVRNSDDVVYLRWWCDLREIRFAECDEMNFVNIAYTSFYSRCVYVFLLFEIEWPVDISGSCEWNQFEICYARIPRHTIYEFIVKTENRSIQFFCDFHVWNWMTGWYFWIVWMKSVWNTLCPYSSMHQLWIHRQNRKPFNSIFVWFSCLK